MTESVVPHDPAAGGEPRRRDAARTPSPSRHLVVLAGVLGMLGTFAVPGLAATLAAARTVAAPASPRPAARWGAIAARPDGHGYAFNQPSRTAAEQVARAQCERPAGKPGTGACDVRVWFENSCGALATGNFGEWGAATGADPNAAAKAAVAQCDAHLPTEPCRVVVSVCSLP